jgi:DNA modification methylase
MKPYKSGTREHLAPFPVELPARLIKAYSYITETILDPFGGMGTTAKAAIQEKRNSIIYEINKTFLPLIESNINDDLFNKVKREIIYQEQYGRKNNLRTI